MSKSTDYSRVCLTLDVDWAPDEVVASAAALIERAGARATFFATNESPVLAALDPGRFEVGLHPNYNNVRDGDFDVPLAALKGLYPAARGGRSHGLYVSSAILAGYRAHGLRYESNVFLYLHENLRPVLRFKDFVSVPFYWSDDKHLELHDTFGPDHLGLDAPGLKVYNFHPMHVFMNTSSEAHYQSYKPHYKDVAGLRERRNESGEGVGTLFSAFLERVAGRELPLLGEVCEEFLSADA